MNTAAARTLFREADLATVLAEIHYQLGNQTAAETFVDEAGYATDAAVGELARIRF